MEDTKGYITVAIETYERLLAKANALDMIASTKGQYGYNDAVINAAVDALGLKVPEVADD